MRIQLAAVVCGLAFVACSVSSAEGEARVGPSPTPVEYSGGTLAVFPSAESRATQYDCGDPTAAEQYVLEMINRARANPTAEGTRLGISITEGFAAGDVPLCVVKPPLAMNKILLSVARTHSQDMWQNNYFAHNDLSGNTPSQRMTAAGYSWTKSGENIACGSNHTAAELEDNLMLDTNYGDGQPHPRGHRLNLLDVYSSAPYREVGIGCYSGSSANPTFKDYITQDFGTSSVGPFLVGVVYEDKNSNSFYDIGEGVSGVTVTPTGGSYYAVTSTSGGYAMPVSGSGSLTVTFSGGPITTPVTKTVTLTGNNVKQDCTTTGGGGGTGGGGDGGTGGGTGGGGTTNYVSNTLTDTDGDGAPDEMETDMGWSPTVANTFPTQTLSFGSPAKLAVKLNFAKSGCDSLSLSWPQGFAAGFTIEGRQVVADIGGFIAAFTLDAKGKGYDYDGYASIKVAGRIQNGAIASDKGAKVTIKVSREVIANRLTDEGLTGTSDASKVVRSVPAVIIFLGNTQHNILKGTFPVYWTARAGRSGNAKGGL